MFFIAFIELSLLKTEVNKEQNSIVNAEPQKTENERKDDELIYKECNPIFIKSTNKKILNRKWQINSELTPIQLEILKLRYKDLFKSNMGKTRILNEPKMKKSTKKQKNSNTGIENKEIAILDKATDTYLIQMAKMEEENRLLKIQIAQSQASIELNRESNIQTQPNEQTIEEIQTQNKFETLLDIEIEDENTGINQTLLHNLKLKNEKKRKLNDDKLADTSKNKQPKTITIDKKKAVTPSTVQTAGSSKQEVTTKTSKPPPIHIESQDPKDNGNASGTIEKFITDLNYIMDYLKAKDKHNYIFLIGDLNAKHVSWNNKSNNARGTK